MSSTASSSAKEVLRRKIRIILKEMSFEDKRLQSEKITEKLLKNEKVVASSRVSIYLSTQNEVSTIDLLRQLMNQGKQVFIPKYDPKSHDMKMVSLKSMEEYESLPMTSWNIKQHPLDWHQTDALDSGGLDLIITPGLAFTKSGQRMGSGRGYYDRYFQKVRRLQSIQEEEERKDQRHHQLHHEPDHQLQEPHENEMKYEQEILIPRKHEDTLFIGLAFRQQILSLIPTDDLDMAMDLLVHADDDNNDKKR